MSESNLPVIEVNGIKTLPLYCMRGITLQAIPRFGSGNVKFEYEEPDYGPPHFEATIDQLQSMGRHSDVAKFIISQWPSHCGNFEYYMQFKDDNDRNLIKAVYDHTELLSILCDLRLKIDPGPLWQQFESTRLSANIHEEYRADPHRDKKWTQYADQLKKSHERVDTLSAWRLIQRMEKQVELLANTWQKMEPLVSVQQKQHTPLSLFYSYSHCDETLRDQLQAHLSLLKRNGVIEEWHDRRISAGREWEGQIDDKLKNAKIILLLISADFLASDYCYDVEMKFALEVHNQKIARVIPVILRACEWHESQFAKLQAIPRDGKAVTSWNNVDEAFTDIAKHIREVTTELMNAK